MNFVKGFAVITIFSLMFHYGTYLFGFVVGLFKSLLSYFCMIGVSGPAVADASGILTFVSFTLLIYFIYRKFFS